MDRERPHRRQVVLALSVFTGAALIGLVYAAVAVWLRGEPGGYVLLWIFVLPLLAFGLPLLHVLRSANRRPRD